MSTKKVLRTAPATPTVRSDFNTVAATTTVSKVVRESARRTEVIVTNTSSAQLYLALSFLPSSTNYSVVLNQGDSFFSDTTDAINGVWASAAGGQANITERY